SNLIEDLLPGPEAPDDNDGVPPPFSPQPRVTPGFKVLFVDWDDVRPTNTDDDDVYYNLYMSTAAGFTPGPEHLLPNMPVTVSFWAVSQLPSGDPIATETEYYFRLVACDVNGCADPSREDEK